MMKDKKKRAPRREAKTARQRLTSERIVIYDEQEGKVVDE